MSRTSLLAAVMVGIAAPCHAADALEVARHALRELRGTAPIEASIERHLVREQKDRPNVSGTATARVSAGADGVRLTLPAAQIATAAAEKLGADVDAARPVSSALTSIDLTDVALALNAAGALLHDLEGATLKRSGPTDADGTALELDLAVHLPKADAANVKEAKSSATLRLDAGGNPVSFEKRTTLHGRILLMSIDITQTESTSYAVHGDRLVAVKEQRINDTAGFGQKAHEERSTAILVGQPSK